MRRRTLVTLLAIVTVAVLALCVWVATPSTQTAVSAANAAVVGPRAGQARASSSPSPVAAPTQVATSVAPDVTPTAADSSPAEANAEAARPSATATSPVDPDADGVPMVSAPGTVRLVSNTETTFTVAWPAASGPVAGYLVTLNGALAATGPATQVTLPWPLTQGNVVVQVYAQSTDGDRSDASSLIVVPPAPASTAVAQPTAAKAACPAAPRTTAAATPTPRPTRTPTTTTTPAPTPTSTPTASATVTPSASATVAPQPAGCSAGATATGAAATPTVALARP